MKRPTYGYFSLFPLLLMLIACGCSNQGKTQLQGEVTYGGQPVALGTITFTPKADGFRAIQTIKDGKFDTRRGLRRSPGGRSRSSRQKGVPRLLNLHYRRSRQTHRYRRAATVMKAQHLIASIHLNFTSS